MTKTPLTQILKQAKSSKTVATIRTIDFANMEYLRGHSDKEVIEMCRECIDAFSHIANSLRAKQGDGTVQFVGLDKQ
jgi:hypothetical protein